MAVDKSLVGTKTGTTRVVVERGPVANFAKALKDDNPVYHDRAAAKAAGFSDIPAPPTFGFCMAHWGAFPDIQPEKGPDVDDGALARAIRELSGKGGLILHGEQEFEYHRPIVVGDVLVGEGEIVDVYEKESKGKTMTFIVTETRYRDERTGEPVLTTRFNLIHRAG